MLVASILGLALSLVPAAMAETGPFFDYCTSNSLSYSTILSSCTNGHASLDLDGGIGNNNGNLVWQDNGGYFGSCASNDGNGGSCSLNYGNLICDCRNNDGGATQSTLGLDAHLYYNTDTNTLYFSGL